jgi:hypothetical protein
MKTRAALVVLMPAVASALPAAAQSYPNRITLAGQAAATAKTVRAAGVRLN